MSKKHLGKTESQRDDLPTSSTLLDHARTGNPDAWEKLVSRYRPVITGYCLRAGLPLQDAENIAQDVFIDLFRRLQKFERKREGSFRKWLAMISRSRAVDFFRSTTRNREIVLDPDTISRLPVNVPAPLNTDNLQHTKQEFESIVNKLKSEFSDRDIAILIHSLADEQSAGQIATEFGVSTNTIYLVRSRMLKRIQHFFPQNASHD